MSPSTPDESRSKAGTVTRHQRVLKEVRETTDEEPLPPPTLDWMDKSLQWGVRVKPGKKGLTMGSLNVGIYGEIPDFWEDRTRMLRGLLFHGHLSTASHHAPLQTRAMGGQRRRSV